MTTTASPRLDAAIVAMAAARQARRDAQEAAWAADRAVQAARRELDAAKAEAAAPTDLISQVADGQNDYAARRLAAGIRALHPALDGFGPTGVRFRTTEFYLKAHVAPNPDAGYLDALETAVRSVVTDFGIPVHEPGLWGATAHRHHLRILTPGCSIYALFDDAVDGPPAFIETSNNPTEDEFNFDHHTPERVAEGTLADMLALSPSYDLLTALGK